MGKKVTPEVLARIAALQTELRELSEQIRGGESDGERKPARQPLPDENIDRVRKLIQDNPMRLAAIMEVTGWDKNKVNPLLTDMRRHGELVLNIGAANKAFWYYPDRDTAERMLDQLLEHGVRSSRLEEMLRDGATKTKQRA